MAGLTWFSMAFFMAISLYRFRPPPPAWASSRSPLPWPARLEGSSTMPTAGRDSASSTVVVKGHLAGDVWRCDVGEESGGLG